MTRIPVTDLDPDLGHVIVTRRWMARVLAVHDLTHVAVRNVTVRRDDGHVVVWGSAHGERVEILDGDGAQ